jgi:hypothetical protein
MALQHKRFPPGRGNLLIPTSTRAATLAGIAMYSPSTRRGFLVQRAAWYSVGLFGSKGLPGNSNAAPPLAPEVWDELHAALLAEAGPYDDWAAHRPPDPHREGLGILLLQEGRPVAFVKVRRERNCEKLRREFEALGLVREANPHSFGFTEPLFEGTVAGRLYAGFAPLPAGLHRPPASPSLDSILADIAKALSPLPRPDDAGADWAPMHGDFTPWNLRKLRGHLYLLDWETAGWGPPGADEVMYQASSAVMGLCQADAYQQVAAKYPETVSYWIEHWQRKIDEYIAEVGPVSKKALAVQMLGVLDAHA